jgi:hypothetical protein
MLNPNTTVRHNPRDQEMVNHVLPEALSVVTHKLASTEPAEQVCTRENPRPDQASPRNYHLRLARARLGQERQPRARSQPKAADDMSIQCAYLPHATSHTN